MGACDGRLSPKYNPAMTTTLKARFDGKTFVPLEPVELPADTVFDIDVRAEEQLPLGSPARILRAMERPSQSSADVVDEWERAIESAKRPAVADGIFDDLA